MLRKHDPFLHAQKTWPSSKLVHIIHSQKDTSALALLLSENLGTLSVVASSVDQKEVEGSGAYLRGWQSSPMCNDITSY